MPHKAGPSSVTGLNTAAAARNAAHPYANAQSTSKASRRTDSLDTKPEPSPTSILSPAEGQPTPHTRSRKKPSAGSQSAKTPRQQFSACHACRYRRVKCDLKDLSVNAEANADISCTNCRERGIRCKDDYADSKKQLRRGKRINQLELEDNLQDQSEEVPMYNTPPRPRTTIPILKSEFFDSPFFKRVHIQRPIIDPIEFRSRYVAWLQHQLSPESNAVLSSATTPLSAEGQLLGKILVVWAASYGVDEGGVEQPENSYEDVRRRRQRVKHMVEEVVRLIDSLSLLRKPSWDGVRCLLMTLPLTEDVLDNPMDRLAIYEAAVQQVYTLCQHDGVTTGLSAETRAANALVRARIFWYAHVHEGLTTGLRGGRLLMDDDDLATFHRELPAPPTFMANNMGVQPSNMTYSLAFQYATAPIRLASACRKVHAALTGPKARAARRLDGKKLEETWEALALCWEEFESLRPIQRSDHIRSEDTTRFIFLFECYNVIQEKIRERLDSARAAQITELDENPDSPATVEGLVRDLRKYLSIAESKCFDVLDHVVRLIRRHLNSTFFAYDASLVRDGCFFAGHTLALMPGRDEDVKVCLQALSEMRWAFSKSYERSQTITFAWRSRVDRDRFDEHPSPPLDQQQTNEKQNVPEPAHTMTPSSNSSPQTGRLHPSHGSSSIQPTTHQQVHVASLPSHSAIHNPVVMQQQASIRHSSQPVNAQPQFTRSPPNPQMPGGYDASSVLNSGENHSTAITADTNTGTSGLPPTGTAAYGPAGSTRSSSSDGSSPPELAPQPMAHFNQVPTKSSPSMSEGLNPSIHGSYSTGTGAKPLPLSPTRTTYTRAPQGYMVHPQARPMMQQPYRPDHGVAPQGFPVQQYIPNQIHTQLAMAPDNQPINEYGYTSPVHPNPPQFYQIHSYQQSMPTAPDPHSLNPEEAALYYPNDGSHVIYSRNHTGVGNRNMMPYATYPQENGLYYTQQG
ncbi:hypothetical protein CPB86DRAFT_814609 [Serendipita vermifera]|nr:hypothetical protein CPB86DRAFT_814609 [Serendipita vermifera]